MNEGRDILDVYKKIDENIPDQYQELKNALSVFIKNLWNISPEGRRSAYIYKPFAEILQTYITTPEEEWAITVKNIFEDKIPI